MKKFFTFYNHTFINYIHMYILHDFNIKILRMKKCCHTKLFLTNASTHWNTHTFKIYFVLPKFHFKSS